jgi:hypothetical protein
MDCGAKILVGDSRAHTVYSLLYESEYNAVERKHSVPLRRTQNTPAYNHEEQNLTLYRIDFIQNWSNYRSENI